MGGAAVSKELELKKFMSFYFDGLVEDGYGTTEVLRKSPCMFINRTDVRSTLSCSIIGNLIYYLVLASLCPIFIFEATGCAFLNGLLLVFFVCSSLRLALSVMENGQLGMSKSSYLVDSLSGHVNADDLILHHSSHILSDSSIDLEAETDISFLENLTLDKTGGNGLISCEEKTVLLTGCTGFLGRFLLWELLKCDKVGMVYCLARGNKGKFDEEKNNV